VFGQDFTNLEQSRSGTCIGAFQTLVVGACPQRPQRQAQTLEVIRVSAAQQTTNANSFGGIGLEQAFGAVAQGEVQGFAHRFADAKIAALKVRAAPQSRVSSLEEDFGVRGVRAQGVAAVGGENRVRAKQFAQLVDQAGKRSASLETSPCPESLASSSTASNSLRFAPRTASGFAPINICMLPST
jgi:hypothetical protein